MRVPYFIFAPWVLTSKGFNWESFQLDILSIQYRCIIHQIIMEINYPYKLDLPVGLLASALIQSTSPIVFKYVPGIPVSDSP